MCVVFFGREYHYFLICFDSTTVGEIEERVRGSASAAIGRRGETSRQIYKKILALKNENFAHNFNAWLEENRSYYWQGLVAE